MLIFKDESPERLWQIGKSQHPENPAFSVRYLLHYYLTSAKGSKSLEPAMQQLLAQNLCATKMLSRLLAMNQDQGDLELARYIDFIRNKGIKPHSDELLRCFPNFEEVKRVLYAGVDPNSADTKGNTALFYAVYTLNIPMIKLLIEAGANISHQNNKGNTILHYAYLFAPKLVPLLKKKAALAKCCNNNNQTPGELLVSIINNPKKYIIKINAAHIKLLSSGELEQVHLLNVLNYAIKYKNDELVAMLINLRFELLDQQNENGKSPRDLLLANKYAYPLAMQVISVHKCQIDFKKKALAMSFFEKPKLDSPILEVRCPALLRC